MKEVAIELSKELRDPEKEGVDIIIALTHCRVPNVGARFRDRGGAYSRRTLRSRMS